MKILLIQSHLRYGVCLFSGALLISFHAACQALNADLHSAACKIDVAEASAAEMAFYRNDFGRAIALAAAAHKSDPADGHSRELEIDSLLGEGKLDEAEKKAEAWTTAQPADAYAITAASDVRHSEGDWLEAYALALRALRINPCIPDAYKNLAAYEALAGYRDTSQKHLALARQIAPKDENIRLTWIESLHGEQYVSEFSKYLEESKAFDEKRRTQLSHQLQRAQARLKDKCELATVSGGARIPMVPIYGKVVGIEYYGIEVVFNGHKRVLQIDTGASGLLLTRSVVSGMGLIKEDTTRVGGFGSDGSNAAELYHADSVRVGGLEFKNCSVEALVNTGVMGGWPHRRAARYHERLGWH